tara:strand:- start:3109 stop:3348 length:240 start_codon:yes stop_codon:yes gene_type:complete
MLKKFTEHPQEQGETYLQHMLGAWRIVFFLKKLEIKCLIHSFLPFCYVDAVSSKLKCLQKMVNRDDVDDDELYEVYGGD